MCTNSMKSDRGCDGSCVVNKDMYKAVMDAIEERIQPTTNNDLGVASELEKNSKKLEKDFGELDCISRADLIERINNAEEQFKYDNMETIGYGDGDPFVDGVLSGVWNIREMVKQAPSVTPQEPKTFKWCTDCKEYDQDEHCCHRWSKAIRDTVEEMKQEYIEREVLDKIRDQLKSNLRGVEITLEVLVENDPLRPKMEGAKCTLEDCLELIDKAESEDKE